MDWILSVTTLLSNSALGWTKGARWMWLLHALNALLWIVFAVYIKQYGLILLSFFTILVDIISAYKKTSKKEMNTKLVFHKWEENDIDLEFGSFHSGSTFDISVYLEKDQLEELKTFLSENKTPYFYMKKGN